MSASKVASAPKKLEKFLFEKKSDEKDMLSKRDGKKKYESIRSQGAEQTFDFDCPTTVQGKVIMPTTSIESDDQQKATTNIPQSSGYTREFHAISGEYLKKKLKNKGIKRLKLRCCTLAGDSIADVLVKCIDDGLEKLVLSGCKISSEHLQYIGENMSRKNKLKDLDLSNIALDETGVKAVAEIRKKATELEWLNLHNCKLSEKLLEDLSKYVAAEENSARKPLRHICLSLNSGVRKVTDKVAFLINEFGCDEIDISSNTLGGTHIAELASATMKKAVNTIHVCENPINDWEALGDLVRNWKVKYLDASECRMHLEDCEDFAFALDDYQLEKLNVCNPDRTKEFAKRTRKFLEGTAAHLMVDAGDFAQ